MFSVKCGTNDTHILMLSQDSVSFLHSFTFVLFPLAVFFSLT